jgi:O-antigen/teichoic acid export membrane protein
MEVPLIAAITVAAGAVMLPEIVKAFGKGNPHEALNLWQLMVRRVTFILLPAGFLFFLVSQELMVILYSEKFKDSVGPFRIYMLMLPARVAYFGMLFQGAGKTKLVLLRAIITLFLNTVITYFLVLKFGMDGAAWGTVAVVWLFVVPYCIGCCAKISDTKWNRLLPYKYIFSVGILSAFVALVSWYLSSYFGFEELILQALAKASIYIVLILSLMLTVFREDFLHIYNQLKLRISSGK